MEFSAPTGTGHAPADSGLRCPKCDYNLTGVAENRCPECGEAFDPERLKAILAGAPAPIPIWDDKSIPVAVRFIRICLLTWFLPHTLSRCFPRYYSIRSAVRFQWTAVLVSLLIWVVPLALAWNAGLLRVFGIFSCAYLAGIATCEALVAAALGKLGPAENPGPESSNSVPDSQMGLVGMFRSFVVLESLVMATGTVADMLRWRAVSHAVGPAMLVIAVWWWTALGTAAAVQRDGLRDKGIAVLAISMIVVFSGFIAFAATLVLTVLVGGFPGD